MTVRIRRCSLRQWLSSAVNKVDSSLLPSFNRMRYSLLAVYNTCKNILLGDVYVLLSYCMEVTNFACDKIYPMRVFALQQSEWKRYITNGHLRGDQKRRGRCPPEIIQGRIFGEECPFPTVSIFNFIHHRNDRENNFKKKDKTSRSKHKQAHCNDKATCYRYLQNKLAEERYLARNLWLRDLTRVLGNSKSNEARQ